MIPIIRKAAEMTDISKVLQQQSKNVALVPTMGALHRGHLALVKAAKEEADIVIVSIYVNPSQFAPDEDLEKYPRTLDKDQAALDSIGGVDYIFHPDNDEIYDLNHAIWIEASGLDKELCGAYRPGHFRGVCTVVYKLFQICKPNLAVFGKKDAQQFVIISALVRDLLLDTEIRGVETIREEDGLALSSRNRYLSEAHRAQAPIIRKAILKAVDDISEGEQQIQRIVGKSQNTIESAPDAQIQYLTIVDAVTLLEVDKLKSGTTVLLATAVYFGKTRLIDNAFVLVP